MHRIARLAAIALFIAAPALADTTTWQIDPDHTSAQFAIRHLMVSTVRGTIGPVTGTVTIDDADLTKSSVTAAIDAKGIDTRNQKRDDHLRSPDFLNAKQYPKISFKSTSVKKEGDKLAVTGDLAMHGVTKSITIPVQILGTGQFPPGTQRVGLEADFTVKRAEFDIKTMPGMVGEDVRLIVALEGAKQ